MGHRVLRRVVLARELALYLSWLAVAYADANEPEAAAGTARRVLELAAEIAAERTAERARVVLAGLARYADVPQVGELLAEYTPASPGPRCPAGGAAVQGRMRLEHAAGAGDNAGDGDRGVPGNLPGAPPDRR